MKPDPQDRQCLITLVFVSDAAPVHVRGYSRRTGLADGWIVGVAVNIHANSHKVEAEIKSSEIWLYLNDKKVGAWPVQDCPAFKQPALDTRQLMRLGKAGWAKPVSQIKVLLSDVLEAWISRKEGVPGTRTSLVLAVAKDLTDS